MFTNKGITMQMLLTKKFNSFPQLGVLSVTSLISDWDENQLVDFMNQSSITYELVRGLNIIGGYHYTENTGFRGTTV
ncbi:hypothetical protein [Myroides odoratus]|nr:hypothetical protein [Myroides odoratus]WQD56679.1 hypothetical protein U0010_14285 [Myroides odoratus]